MSFQNGAFGMTMLKPVLVNFSPATFSYAQRIFLDKVRPDNFFLFVFLHTQLSLNNPLQCQVEKTQRTKIIGTLSNTTRP